MASELPVNGSIERTNGSDLKVKAGLARMLKGGVIMDVVNAEQVSPYCAPSSQRFASYL